MAVTDDAIYVLNSPRLSVGARLTSVVTSLPRDTRLAAVSGQRGEFTLLGKRHWVKTGFQGELLAADAGAGLAD